MNIKVPVSWLREYLKTDVNAKTIANYLTLSGPSVERIEKQADDYIFDVEVTTNRPDAFSVFGLAREANTILNSENQKSELIEPKGLSINLEPDTGRKLPLEVVIKNQSLCPRFSAIIIDNVKIRPSPAYIKNRLTASGIRAINNIVDIANYVMLELGQPMHTFDYDKIKGAKMILRESNENERIKTIDEKTRKLPKGAIVIEDQERLIDLCGIMGGANSQISSRTKRVIIFVQAYDPQRIRKTTQSLAFRTEAASRFEKGIDLEGILPALKRAIYLAKQDAGAKIASELIDIYKNKPKPSQINLNLKRLEDYLGIKIQKDVAAKILNQLGFKTTTSEQTISATPPSWRFNDVEQEEDLIEEIARVYGYHKLPSTLPQGQIPDQYDSEQTHVTELKKALKFLGLTEVISYSIISKDFLALTQVPKKDAVELQNPLTEEWQFMRPTLIVSLAAIIGTNQNFKKDLKIFEIARTYHKQQNDIPKQDLVLTIAIQNSNFYEIKGFVENIAKILRRHIQFHKPSSKLWLLEKNQSAYLSSSKIVENKLIPISSIGQIGILDKNIQEHFGIDSTVAVAEINLSAIFQIPQTSLSYKLISKYPPVIEDLSAIFDEDTSIGKIIYQVEDTGAPLIKNADVIDVFRSEKIGKDKKSITIRITYQKTSGTPAKEEVEKTRDKILDSIIKLGGIPRLKLSPL